MTTPTDSQNNQGKRMTDEELNAAIRDLQQLAEKLIAERRARVEEAQQRKDVGEA